ncbi:MAG: hypothetical protein O3C39_01860 [Planctomycetota bacterium]|jgi:hypothetical protein|nr:hypothetical protein [Planctomycetota bacterium]MDA1200407.1 hypothetical protein [Planctomycetota bacterium]
MSPLVSPASMFRFRLPCSRRETLWPPAAAGLDDRCRLPSLASVVGVPDVLELFAAWNDEAIAFRGIARGVGAKRWCHPAKPEDSDGLHLWIATRPTGESHRAGRFCRRLAVLPTGGGRRADRPVVVPAVIPRTSELPAELPEGATRVEAELGSDGWRVDVLLSAAALPGWDPAEISRLGFFAALVDRRLGSVPCYAPPEYPWESDPTTWAELELTG